MSTFMHTRVFDRAIFKNVTEQMLIETIRESLQVKLDKLNGKIETEIFNNNSNSNNKMIFMKLVSCCQYKCQFKINMQKKLKKIIIIICYRIIEILFCNKVILIKLFFF